MPLKFGNSRKTSEKGVLDVFIWCHLCLALTGVDVPKKYSCKFLAFISVLRKGGGGDGTGRGLKPNSVMVSIERVQLMLDHIPQKYT